MNVYCGCIITTTQSIHDNNNNDDNNDDDDDTTSFTLTAQVGLSPICEVGRDIQKSSQHVAR